MEYRKHFQGFYQIKIEPTGHFRLRRNTTDHRQCMFSGSYPTQTQFVSLEFDMPGKDKEPSVISEILFLQILGLNLWFGSRCHIFPAHLLSSTNKSKDFTASS